MRKVKREVTMSAIEAWLEWWLLEDTGPDSEEVGKSDMVVREEDA